MLFGVCWKDGGQEKAYNLLILLIVSMIIMSYGFFVIQKGFIMAKGQDKKKAVKKAPTADKKAKKAAKKAR